MFLPPYATFPKLTAAGLWLRQLTDEDLPDILEISFYDARPATSVAEAATMLRRIEADYARGDCLHWGLAEPQTGRVVGTLGFYRGFPGGIGEIGCVLRPAWRGRGLMQPALAAVIEFGLETMGLQSIVALTTAQNIPAQRLVEKLGFRPVAAEYGAIRYCLY